MHGCAFSVLGMGGWPGWLFMAAVVVGLAFLFSRLWRQQGNFDRRDSVEILKRRLAAGEITSEEFERLMKYL